MSSIDQIYGAVRSLPVTDRLRLVERVVHDVIATPREPAGADGDPLIGLFAQEPDLIDEVCRIALEDRMSRPLRTSDG
jgi:hypothetical protein